MVKFELCKEMINSKFSIITISFNEEKFIENTVESIINQKYSNIEYIIIDGGSSDRTIEILKKYEEYINYCISEKDNGIYDAMNKGIEKATGDYIIFMNAGDTFFNEEVLKLVNKEIQESKSDFVYGNAMEFDPESSNHFFKPARSIQYLWYGMFAHHQSMFYNNHIIKKHNLKYNIKYRIAADYDFTYRFLNLTRSVTKLNYTIAVFLRGGLSNQNYFLGNREQWQIKKDIGDFNIFFQSFIMLLKMVAYIIKNILPFIYNRTIVKKS